MTDVDDDHDQAIIVDRVNDSIVADADAIRIFAGQLDRSRWTRILSQRSNTIRDATPHVLGIFATTRSAAGVMKTR